MVDTPRSLAVLTGTTLAGGSPNSINSQSLRDFAVSVPNGLTLQAATSYADDAAAAAGGVPVGGFYRNGNIICVRLT